MNRLLRNILLTILTCFNLCGYAQYKKVSLNSLNSDLKLKIAKFGFDLYSSKTVSDVPLLDKYDASKAFIDTYNQSKQGIVNNKWFINNYGDLNEMLLKEVLIDSENNKIFRYKTSHLKTDLFSEVRVTINKIDKYSEIIRKYFWSDSLYKAEENLPKKIVLLDKIKAKVLEDNKSFVKKSFNKCFASQMYPLNRINTTYYSNNRFFKELLLKKCDSVKKEFGNLKLLKLQEVLSDNYYYKIYRYKAVFDKIKDTIEVRVTTDMKNKYSKLQDFYWKETFYEEINNMAKESKKED